MSDTMAGEIRAVVDRHVADGFSGVGQIKRGDDALLHEAYGLAHRVDDGPENRTARHGRRVLVGVNLRVDPK